MIPVKQRSNDPWGIEDTPNLNELEIERRFGRTPFFLLIETENRSTKLLPNRNHHFNGNTSPYELAEENGVNTVLAAHLGYGPYVGFQERNIPILRADLHKSITDIIEEYSDGKLETLSAPEKGTCCSGTKKH